MNINILNFEMHISKSFNLNFRAILDASLMKIFPNFQILAILPWQEFRMGNHSKLFRIQSIKRFESRSVKIGRIPIRLSLIHYASTRMNPKQIYNSNQSEIGLYSPNMALGPCLNTSRSF